MTGKSQAKTKCETPKGCQRKSLKKGGFEVAVSRSPPLIYPHLLTEVGENEWKQTTKREHSWFGYDCCIVHQECVRDFSENNTRV